MKVFKVTLFASVILINMPAYAAGLNNKCDEVKEKRAKIVRIYYGTPSPLGFSVMVNTLSDDGKTSGNSNIISFPRKAKSKGGVAAIALLISAIDNNYIFVINGCENGGISAFHIETNSIIIKK